MVRLASKASIVLFFICLNVSLIGQSAFHGNATLQNSLPTVFILGEFDVQYEAIIPNYKPLLEASGGDMEGAFAKLTSMMLEMEAYAELSEYDLRGIHAWMHFFWGMDGTVDHIGFHLKPNSRNVDLDKLKNFLNGFAANYRFPLSASFQYAHYSSFAFPLNFRPKVEKTIKVGN